MRSQLKLTLALLVSIAGVALGGTSTENMGLYKPAVGEVGWGASVNSNFDILDASVPLLGGNNVFTASNTFVGPITFSTMTLSQIILGTSTYSGSEPLVVNGTVKFFTSVGGVLSLCDRNGVNCTNLTVLHANPGAGVVVTTMTITRAAVTNMTLTGAIAADDVIYGDSAMQLYNNAGGRPNVAIGASALGNIVYSTGNVAMGYGALSSLTSGGENTAVGDFAGAYVQTGDRNIIIGNLAGAGAGGAELTTSGSDNIWIGQYTGGLIPANTLNHTVAIGAYANPLLSNTVVIGPKNDSSTTRYKVGVGTDTPRERLHVDGTVRIDSGSVQITSLAINECVKIDANGNLATTGSACSGGGAASSLGVNDEGVSITSPTAQINFVGAGVTVTANGSTATVTIAGGGSGGAPLAGATYYIQVADTLQSGATFYVSSGTATDFNVSTITLANAIRQPTSVGTIVVFKQSLANSTAFVGMSAGQNNTTGQQNVGFGGSALVYNSTGSNNTAVGFRALQEHAGFGNTAVGDSALGGLPSAPPFHFGSSNTAVGLGAGGGYNPLGSTSTTSGNLNTFLGFNASQGSASQLTNATAIGANAFVMSSNTIQMGGTGTSAAAVVMSTFTASSGTVTQLYLVDAGSITSNSSTSQPMYLNSPIAGKFRFGVTDGSGPRSVDITGNRITFNGAVASSNGLGWSIRRTHSGTDYGVLDFNSDAVLCSDLSTTCSNAPLKFPDGTSHIDSDGRLRIKAKGQPGPVANLYAAISVSSGGILIDPGYGDTAATPVTGIRTAGEITVGSATVRDLAENECVQTTTGGRLTTTGAACGSGGGGGASTLETLFGTARSSPTATVKGSVDFLGSVTSSTMTISMNPQNSALTTFLSSMTVIGAGLWTSPAQSTFTYGLTVGSITVTGSGAGALDLTEGTAPSGIASHDILYADSTANWLKFIPNNTSTYTVVGTSHAVTAGNCAKFSSNGSLLDAGAACGTGAGGGGSGIVSPGTFTWTNNFGASFSTMTISSATLTILGPTIANYVSLGLTDTLATLRFFQNGVNDNLLTFGDPGGLSVNHHFGTTGTNRRGQVTGSLSSIDSGGAPVSDNAGIVHMMSAGGNPAYLSFSERGIADRGTLGFGGGSGDLVLYTGSNAFGSGTERLRVSPTGGMMVRSSATFDAAIRISSSIALGLNRGTTGQVLSSGGADAAPFWATAGAGSDTKPALAFNLDGGGVVISSASTSLRRWSVLPYDVTVSSWNVTCDTNTATVSVSVSTTSFSGFTANGPSSGGSICASACPSLSSGAYGKSGLLTGWVTALSATNVVIWDITGSAPTNATACKVDLWVN